MRVPGLRSIDQSVRSRLFVRDLQYLNDVLSRSPASDCYWMWAGLLLGWRTKAGCCGMTFMTQILLMQKRTRL